MGVSVFGVTVGLNIVGVGVGIMVLLVLVLVLVLNRMAQRR